MPWKKMQVGEVTYGSVIRYNNRIMLFCRLDTQIYLPESGWAFFPNKEIKLPKLQEYVDVYETDEKVETLYNSFSFLKAIANLVHKEK